MRIAIVNDSAMAAEALRRLLLATGRYEVAWTASNGAEAVEKCLEDRPDLVLMDLVMPVMDGIEATRRIIAHGPCPILIVTAVMEENIGQVFQCLGAGALDVFSLPELGRDPAVGGAALIAKIDQVAQLAGTAAPRKRLGSSLVAGTGKLVVLGASAGGPSALAHILGDLPADFPAAVVLVQHIDAEFATSMAQWLGGLSRMPVSLARDGDQPAPGRVLMAGTDEHLRFKDSRTLTYSSEPSNAVYRPSIDVFFDSVLQHWPGMVTAVLLTGMGRDGVAGLRRLRDAGKLTIAQDQESSVVYGMPKAAAAAGAASEILPLGQIASRLVEFIDSKSS